MAMSIFYAADQNHVFAFMSAQARDDYCEKVDPHVKAITARERGKLNTRGHHAYFLYNEHCGRYSVIAFDASAPKAKRGRR